MFLNICKGACFYFIKTGDYSATKKMRMEKELVVLKHLQANRHSI